MLQAATIVHLQFFNLKLYFQWQVLQCTNSFWASIQVRLCILIILVAKREQITLVAHTPSFVSLRLAAFHFVFLQISTVYLAPSSRVDRVHI
jgi:hypothetical protein